MVDEYIRKADAVSIAESYEVKRDGFHLNDYEYGRNQVADSIASDLEDMSPADVVPVVHGRWIKYTGMGKVQWMCSECSAEEKNPKVANYCYHCGAKMDAKEKG